MIPASYFFKKTGNFDMGRGTSLIIVLLFLFFIFLPPLLWIITPDAEVSTFEKRRLATPPSCNLTWQCVASYPKQLELYYSDHFGLRDQLINLHNFIYIKIFKKSPNSAVTIGSDNWLYYNADHTLADFLGLWKVDVQTFESWRRVLQDRQEWLADKGIKYLVMIVPFKMMVYPDYLPPRIRRRAGVPLMLDFLEYLKNTGGDSVIVDILSTLCAGNVNQPTFFRTDTHWNMEGAYRAYLAIMQRIRQWYPDIRIVQDDERIIHNKEYIGDLSIMLHLSRTLKEQAPDVQIKNICNSSDSIISSLKKLPTEMDRRCPDNTPSLLVLHDSYGSFIRPYFDASFKKVHYAHSTFQSIKGFVEKELPHIIIDERAQRYFARMFHSDPEVEGYVMQKHFQQSEDQRFLVRNDLGAGQFVDINDVEISQKNDGLYFRATGNDPFVEIRFKDRPKPDCFLVHLAITSSVDTTMQLFYTTEKKDEFSPEMVVSKKINKGFNEYLFRLPHPDTVGKIRFDPGMLIGEYIVHSLSIKGEWYDI